MKAVLDLPAAHIRALEDILRRIPAYEVLWVLTGSAGLRLLGVDIPVNDLDLQGDAESVYIIEKRLAEFVHTPVHTWESERTRSLDGKAEMEGVEVELIGDIAKRGADGEWEPATDLSRRIFIEWRGMKVPVLPLEIEAEAYAAMGRLEKAGIIRAAIKPMEVGKRD